MEAKRSDRVVIHELLAFVQQKLDVMDELSLEQICITSYTEDNILAAKKVLADTAVTNIRLGTRQRDGRGKKDLQDIFRVFKETDPDDVPTFVARDLHKLPPVTFDHVDATRLLKDIMILRADVNEMRFKLDLSEQNVKTLTMELAEMRSKIAAPTISPSSARNITLRRRGIKSSVSISASPIFDTVASHQVDDRAPIVVSTDVSTPNQQKSPAHAPLAPPEAILRNKSYAQVSRSSRMMTSTKIEKPIKVDKDGFTLVEKKKRRRRPRRNQRGTASPAASTTTLRAADPMTAMYLSRFEKSTPGADVLKYIKERCHGRLQSGDELLLSRLDSTRTTSFKSFLFRFPAKYKDIFLDPAFWPTAIVFRRYREPRPKTVNL